jgi:hypothetical protein
MGCKGIATTLASLCRQVEKLTKLTLPMPTRCITALLTMKLPLPPPQPPSIGWEDNTCSTNANSSPTMSALTVFWALKSHALLDQPLLASPVGGKDGKGNCGSNNGTKFDHAPDLDDPPLPPPEQWRVCVKDGGQVKSKATKRAMAMAIRVAIDDNGNGNGGKSMVAAMRLAGKQQKQG